MHEVIMPKAGMAMEEGTIIAWLKKEGESVRKGEDLVTIETNKISMEEPSPADGVVLKLLYEEGAVVPVATVIAYVGQAGEALPGGQKAETGQPAAAGLKVPASPAARRLARQKGIELSSIGEPGPVRKEAVLRAAAKAGSRPAPQAGKRVRIEGVQMTIFSRMAASHAEVASSTTTMPVDAARLLEIRKELNESPDRHITINDFVIKAAANTLKAFPEFNASIDGGCLALHEAVNVGFALGLNKLLLVPVIANAVALSLFEISKKAKSLAERAKAGTLSPDDLASGTFTVSNVGMYGVTHFTPLVNLPQVAILGVCAVQAGMMNLCLSYDHRVVNGVESAMFLQHLRGQLEKPLGLIVP